MRQKAPDSFESLAKVVKAIYNKRFGLILYQLDSGMYCVKTEASGYPDEYSDKVADLKIALSLFDTKLMALEGN